MTVRPLDPVVVDLARLVWILAQRTDGTITVTEDEMRSIPDRHQIAITGYEPDPPGPLIVRVGPNPPCPACNDYGVITTLDDETVEPCTECAPPPDPPKAQAIAVHVSPAESAHIDDMRAASVELARQRGHLRS